MDTLPHSQLVVEVEAKLQGLAESESLSVAEALDRAQEIADLVEQAAGALEGMGDSERAADLYTRAAHAFQIAAEKVPRTDRRQVASLGDVWQLKADVARYAASMALSVEEPKVRATGSLTPKTVADEVQPSTGAFRKPGRIGAGRRTGFQVPSFPGESESSTVSREGAPKVLGVRVGSQPSPSIREPDAPPAALRRLSKAVGERRPPGESPLHARPLRRPPVVSEKPNDALGDGRQYQVQSPPQISESRLSHVGRLRKLPDSETSDEV